MNEKTVSKKKIALIAGVLVVLIAAFALIFALTRPETTQGAKTIHIEVVVSDTDTREYTLHTDQEYLRGALEEENLISGTESAEYGLFVTTVDGITADDSLQQWWCFTKGGEIVNTGVDTTPIQDGDQFEITLTTGY